MTFNSLSDDSDVEDIGHDTEFWHDDEYVRFGHDVASGKCVCIWMTEMDDFADAVNKNETGRYSFDTGRHGSSTFLFENDHPEVFVYHDREHVASFTDYELYPLRTIQQKVRDAMMDWDPEKRAREACEEVLGYNADFEVRRVDGPVVECVLREEIFSTAKMCNVAALTGNHRAYQPESFEADSFEDFERAVQNFLEGVNVSVTDDGEIEYTVSINTDEVV